MNKYDIDPEEDGTAEWQSFGDAVRGIKNGSREMKMRALMLGAMLLFCASVIGVAIYATFFR